MKKGMSFILGIFSVLVFAQDLKNDFKGTSAKDNAQRKYHSVKVLNAKKTIYLINNSIATDSRLVDLYTENIESVMVFTQPKEIPAEHKNLFDATVSGVLIVKLKKDSVPLKSQLVQDLNKKYQFDTLQPIYLDGTKIPAQYSIIDNPKFEYDFVLVDGKKYLAIYSTPKFSPGI